MPITPRRRLVSRCILMISCLCLQQAAAQTVSLTSQDDSELWQATAADGVAVDLETIPSDAGVTLRIDYDFSKGAGFCIIRRPVPMDLAGNYRFDYRVRGSGPANDLEFKLLDHTGENVWWVNRRAFLPPTEWTRHTNRKRHYEFAWGPSGGEPIERLGWIEFAVAASRGGSGTIEIDRLSYTPLDPETPYTGTPVFTDLATGKPPRPDAHAGDVGWAPGMAGEHAALGIDFGAERTLTSLVLDWGGTGPAQPFDYSVTTTTPTEEAVELARVTASTGGLDTVWLGEIDARSIAIELDTSAAIAPTLGSIRFLTPDDASSLNALLRTTGETDDDGLLPPMYHGQQAFWTIIGTAGHPSEALLGEYGTLELSKGGQTIEPFLLDRSDGTLISWKNSEHTQSLLDGELPIPSVIRRSPGLTLGVTAVATGDEASADCLARYTIENTADETRSVELLLATRPIQVLPYWQSLNLTGGFSPINQISVDRDTIAINSTDRVESLTTPASSWTWDLQDTGLALPTESDAPIAASMAHTTGTACAGWRYALTLKPGETADVVIRVPLADADGSYSKSAGIDPTQARDAFVAALRREADRWDGLLSSVTLRLPDASLRHTLRSTLAHILINRDGPAIQPGSRTYERAWIRDGSITGAALMAFGETEPMREYLDWYTDYQYNNGKVPCVVDHRGPDPVDEHDSTGQLIFAIARYARVTGDTAILRRHEQAIADAVSYLELLIALRSTTEYEGTAYFGLVPASISHEGYSAKPMHSYWDCFFVLQGLRDAAWIAERLGDSEGAEHRRGLAQRFASNLTASIEAAAETNAIDYIPGCVELGDFDPTSTAVAIAPLEVADALPPTLLRSTLAQYWDWFEARRLGTREWRDYTPYEMRVVGAMVASGSPGRAQQMTAWFLDQQTPTGWNQWPEVIYAERRHPGFIGDLPHTWCGAGLLNSFVVGLVHPTPDAVLIGLGVPDAWYESPDGFEIDGIRTTAGTLTLGAAATGEDIHITARLKETFATSTPHLLRVPAALHSSNRLLINGIPSGSYVARPAPGTEQVMLELTR